MCVCIYTFVICYVCLLCSTMVPLLFANLLFGNQPSKKLKSDHTATYKSSPYGIHVQVKTLSSQNSK